MGPEHLETLWQLAGPRPLLHFVIGLGHLETLWYVAGPASLLHLVIGPGHLETLWQLAGPGSRALTCVFKLVLSKCSGSTCSESNFFC